MATMIPNMMMALGTKNLLRMEKFEIIFIAIAFITSTVVSFGCRQLRSIVFKDKIIHSKSVDIEISTTKNKKVNALKVFRHNPFSKLRLVHRNFIACRKLMKKQIPSSETPASANDSQINVPFESKGFGRAGNVKWLKIVF
jgi:hypothetical protein